MTTALLLAAGRSKRFGSACKLQTVYGGKPLVRHAAEAILQTGLPAVAVVADPAVARLLPEFRHVFSKGVQSQSLRAGLQKVTDNAALIVLADMPHVDADVLRRIAASPGPTVATDGTRICPPVLLTRALFPLLEQLTGDHGAGKILKSMKDLCHIHVAPEILKDVDVPADIELAR